MNTKHTYSSFHKFSVFLSYVWIIGFLIFGFLFLGISINVYLQGGPVSILNTVENFLMVSVIFPFFFIYVGFLETEIHVDEEGLNLKSPLKIFRIKWEDVIEIRRASLFGLPMGNNPSIVITKSKLPLFHYLYGIVYGHTIQPSFYFSSSISNSDELRQTIIDAIKKNRIARQLKAKKDS